MVLYYGLLALETANNTIVTNTTASERASLSDKGKFFSNSTGMMFSLPSAGAGAGAASSSSSNSWIYTKDLKKRFEERYANYRYILVPVYVDRASSQHHQSTTGTVTIQGKHDNAWMYPRSVRNHSLYETSRTSDPLKKNISLSISSIENNASKRTELSRKKGPLSEVGQRSLLSKQRSITSLPSKFSGRRTSSSLSSFTVAQHSLTRDRSNDVVEEDDEGIEHENHSVVLTKDE